ncbi:MAG TPA: DUF4445 domain-containing protein [Candidatus Caccousia avistercoris]|nr:DUF4445 domain-containing protein [Candidatus Caccousia avistercoris]
MAHVIWNGESRDVQPGTRLSQVLPRGAVETPCAGAGRCGKCRVRVQGQVSPPSPEEQAHLTREELAQGIRLACRTLVMGDCRVDLPGARGGDQIRTGGSMPDFPLAPAFRRWGAAVDIGTTTLAARLYGPDGRLAAEAGAPNPQASWGADVISRIGAALQGEGAALAASVRAGAAALLEEMAEKAGVPVEQIDAAVVTGNTAMLYLLTETCPDALSHAPFQADRLFGEETAAGRLGLPCRDAAVYLPPCMSAFVGADITTALLASGICNSPGTRMMADIGTNGEIALWAEGHLRCCSTAAGPAFEGAGISMGMPGKDGAIDHVSLQGGKLCAHVLGDAPPAGICGSGIVDALACLLETGDLDETGFLEDEEALLLPPVRLTQKDIRMVQLAKSAVCAGMRTLLHTAGIPMDQVEELAIAGGFGSYLDAGNAGRIGLIPPELAPRVRVLGNAALSGASMLLLNRDFRPAAQALAAQAETVDLTSSEEFLAAYTEGMFF